MPHEFRYSVFQMYLDLDELPNVFDSFFLWSSKRPAIAWFRRQDHLGAESEPLDVSVRNEVQRQTGTRPEGPIRLLTNLRYFGYVMNPVSYYYCFNRGSNRLESVLAEVHNTPWGERHCYVLNGPVDAQSGTTRSLWKEKEFHVSPFMPMNMRYRWQMTEPGTRLSVHLENHDCDVDVPAKQTTRALGPARPAFDVTLALRRQEITSAALCGILLKHPCMTATITVAIYWQALRLWMKGVPFFPHRGRAPQTTIPSPSASGGGP